MSHDYSEFQEMVWKYFREHGRDLPWRQLDSHGKIDPYKVLVSEIMLQQTQVARVIPKYEQFLSLFPDITSLAQTSQQAVLIAWNGLGYNRRARFLHQTAQTIAAQYAGIVPQTEKELVGLPGVGINTARAILAYAFNQPVVFIETNIRTVYIHHFFENQAAIRDTDVLELVRQTLDQKHPREWYWALMDYGTHLKTAVGNLSRYSKHYAKQSTFKGSKRQVRGAILKLLVTGPRSRAQLLESIQDERFDLVLQDLLTESLITQEKGRFTL